MQEDGTAMGSHISCSSSDITMCRFDLKDLCWERFGDDIFAVFIHSLQGLHKFPKFMYSIDAFSEIKFTMTIANNDSGFKLTCK